MSGPGPSSPSLLGDDLADFASIYDASPGGNWEGSNILNRLAPSSQKLAWRTREAELRRISRHACLTCATGARSRGATTKCSPTGTASRSPASHMLRAPSDPRRPRTRRGPRFGSSPNRCRTETGSRIRRMEGTLVCPGVATDYANMIRAALDLFALDGDRRLPRAGRGLVQRRRRASFRCRIAASTISRRTMPPR